MERAMLEDRLVHLNGEMVPWNRANAHLMSHSFGRGSAIFEVLGFHDTAGGPAVFRLKDHLDRLFVTAGLLEMELKESREDLRKIVFQTFEANGLRQGFIKIIAFYGQIAFGPEPPLEPLHLSVFAIDPTRDLDGPPMPETVSLCLSKWCKLDPRTVPVKAKVAANYLNGMMSRLEARERGFNNAVMLDTSGHLAEGSTESVFFVKDGKLVTPAPDGILDSITRRSVLELAQALEIPTEQKNIGPDFLPTAEEVFLSGTPMKVLPVHTLEQRRIEPTPGPLTRRLGQAMADICDGESDLFPDWLERQA